MIVDETALLSACFVFVKDLDSTPLPYYFTSIMRLVSTNDPAASR